ncbi:MAG: hypothetical protein JXR42_05930 [Gammaproteobacteria bacterium]|nr:hypothetical protein [Gammaproteobacteria bacterium]
MEYENLNTVAEEFFTTKNFDLCKSVLEECSQHKFIVSFEFVSLGSNEIYIIKKHKKEVLFIFDIDLPLHPYRIVLAKHWIHSAKLTIKALAHLSVDDAECIINLGDYGTEPGFAFSDHRIEFPLIPDPIFIMTNGYSEYKNFYANQKEFESKKDALFWRGATTGFTDLFGADSKSWETIARVQLCKFCYERKSEVEMDVYLSNLVQIPEDNKKEVIDSGLVKDSVDWKTFIDYKYQIDIDGNSNSWPGLFLKLLTSSPVLKIDSALGFRQWYYDRLIPWHNYIPIKKDLSDLVPTVDWLNNHPMVAKEIGRNGYNLAASMTNNSELIFMIKTLSRCNKLS